MLEPLYDSFGLTGEQMRRACSLLEQAGFIRGFDEAHLKQTLDPSDTDYALPLPMPSTVWHSV